MHRIPKPLLVLGVILFVVAGVLIGSRSYTQLGSKPVLQPGQKKVLRPEQNTQVQSVPFKVESVAEGLEVPWAIAFTSPDRMLVTERVGRIRAIERGALLSNPLYTFAEFSNTGEEGLMGLALDPEYPTNKALYVCISYNNKQRLVNKVVRLLDKGNEIVLDKVLLDNVPAAKFHAGCRVKVGPDNLLYVSTGDALEKSTAQDLNALSGKLLRMNLDGSVPKNNPFPNSYVFSYGHRNVQGFDWSPQSGEMVATEHGPSVIDGPAGGDEVNHVQAGKNYGWPVVSHEKSAPGMESPLIVFTPAVAPASGIFYRGSVFPQFTNAFLFGGLAGEGMYVVRFVEGDVTKVSEYERPAGIDVGRVREVVEGPDGFVYFTTSNRDGRGKVRVEDDHVYRLRPIESQ